MLGIRELDAEHDPILLRTARETVAPRGAAALGLQRAHGPVERAVDGSPPA
jgi:hypothetical protein